jgi:hypothetical protein
MSVPRTLRASAVLGIAFAAACSDSSHLGPGTLVDPTATAAALASFDSAFGSATLASFTSLSLFMAPTAALAPAGRVLTATQPVPFAAGTSPEAALEGRLSGLRDFASLALNPQGPLIPDTLYGSIFTWDAGLGGYTRSQTTGGPGDGVRFILYAVNPLTGTVSVPLTPVGQVDLLDESSGTSAQLHIIVAGNTGTPTYVDYTTTLTIGLGTLTATVTGSVTNALQPPANKTLSFSAIASFALSEISVHATYTLNNPAFTVVLDIVDANSRPTDTIEVDLLISRPNEAIRFTGGLVTTAGVVDTVSAAITVNAQLYARMEGNATGVTFYDRNGAPIQDTATQHDILVALDHIRHVAEGVLTFTAALFQPILNLLTG